MDQRSTYLLQVLEKIGVPLMAAIQDTPALESSEPDQDSWAAEKMAEMLAKSVQMGLSMSQNLDLQEGGDADSIRLALSALAGGLIAGGYRTQGKVPDDEDVVRMTKALEAVITFAGNFTPAAEHAERLKTLNVSVPLFDANQVSIYYIGALTPILEAVAEFPFGQAENKLVQDIAEKLTSRAESLRERLVGLSNETEQQKFAQLMIISALAQIYASCHKGQTKKLLQEEEKEASIDQVWDIFDSRLSMLETLLSAVIPGGETDSASIAPSPQSAPPVQQTIPDQPAPEQVQAPPASIASEQPAQENAAQNPMGFFANKPSEAASNAQPEQPAAPPPVQPTQADVPPAAPPPTDQNSSPPPDAGQNPMAFFKPQGNKQDDQNSTDG